MVENEGFNVQDYSLLVAVHSNSFTHVWSQSARNVPLEEWLSNGAYTRAWLEDLAKKLNSAQVMDPQRDGFYVELTFVKRLGRGGKNGGKKANPGRHAWEKLAKKKRSVVTIQNKDNLCLARAIVTMKERVDNGSQYQNLRKGRPIQKRLAKLLHREAGVPEGPCGFEELEKFQEYLGPQGYQLIVVEPSKCLVVFKDSTYNEAPHVIGLVKYNGHYDGLTSIPALMNRSYYCRHCDRGYDVENSRHHNCEGQNCCACLRQNKSCPNFATWVKPTIHCPDCNCMFYGQDCFQAHKTKGEKKGDQSICDRWKKCPLCCAEYQVIPKKPHKCYHATCRNCGEFTHVAHRCYIQPIKEAPPQQQDDFFDDPMNFNDDDDDERGPPPPPVLNFADIECAISEDRVFQPNLICWSSEEDEEIHHARTIEEFLEACEALTEVEDDERPRKVITFFHNLRGFDGNYILEALYDQGRAVERPLTQGAKENLIALEPLGGWHGNHINQSTIALEWLYYQDHLLGGMGRVRHVRNGGEVQVLTPAEMMFVDGFDQVTNTIYEFYSCWYHGCPRCFKKQRNVRRHCHNDRTVQEVYEATERKAAFLRQAGYTVVEKWE